MALRVDDVDLVRDRALVERFQEGDPAAFDTLYTRYFCRLVRFCQKRVGDPHEAEEIAQEAFAKALRALPAFEGERRFYPWMTVIAGRLCVDAHRRRGRTEPCASIDLGVIEGGQEKVVDLVDLDILRTAMNELAPRHREVLDLRELQGWSYQQIADHYDVTLGTVEALLFRARKALKREFMAVVGGDRNWAALPVVGGLLRRVAGWKARLEAAGSAGLPALGGTGIAAAMFAVTAVTGAVGAGVLHGRGEAAAAGRTEVVRAANVSTGSASDLSPNRAGAPSDVVTRSPVSTSEQHRASATADGDPTLDGTVASSAAALEADHDGASSRDIARDQPVQGHVGEAIHAGADPIGAVGDVLTPINHAANDAQQEDTP